MLHPSSTPKVEGSNGRRFLLWNMTGMVLSRDENVFSAIEVEFNSIEKHKPIRLTDHYSFTMAALAADLQSRKVTGKGLLKAIIILGHSWSGRMFSAQ